MSSFLRLSAAVLVGVALTAACAQPHDTDSTASAVPQTPAPGPKPASTAPTPATTLSAPYTGLPWVGDIRSARRGTVVAVVNDPGAGPVPGAAGAADLVLQELDGSQFRLLTVFQSNLPNVVTPVGDLRASDLNAIRTFSPGVLYSFAYPLVRQDLHTSGVVDLGPSSSAAAAYSGPGRADAARAAGAASLPVASEGLFNYAEPGQQLASTGAQPVRQIDIRPSGLPAQSWTWDATAHHWKLGARESETVTPTNLIIQYVEYRPTSRKRADGSTILAPKVLGRGQCVAFSAGSASPCQWFKPDQASLPVYSDPSGAPLRFQRGSTWTALVPTGTPVEKR